MSIQSFFKSLFPFRPNQPSGADAFNVEQFIYVKIPGNIGPMDRGEMFEDKIDPVLAERGLGSVSGGGSSLGDELPDGRHLIEFCGIDIDTCHRDETRAVLWDLLQKLNAPVGTELHYTKGGQKLQDELTKDGWVVERPRVFLHPGFGV